MHALHAAELEARQKAQSIIGKRLACCDVLESLFGVECISVIGHSDQATTSEQKFLPELAERELPVGEGAVHVKCRLDHCAPPSRSAPSARGTLRPKKCNQSPSSGIGSESEKLSCRVPIDGHNTASVVRTRDGKAPG